MMAPLAELGRAVKDPAAPERTRGRAAFGAIAARPGIVAAESLELGEANV